MCCVWAPTDRSVRWGWQVRRVLHLAGRLQSAPAQADALIREFVASHTFPLTDGETATFFYYDGEPAERIRLMHWVFGLESQQEFRRLGSTNAYYLPLELPLSSRVEYKLAVTRGGRDHWMRDPLNPRRAFDPFGSNSVCPMPGYAEPWWVQPEPGVRQGTVQRFEVKSNVYGDVRPIDVYLPVEFAPYRRFPLLIVHDGDDYRKFAGMIAVLDNLIHRHEVAPLIVAFTSGVHRNREYGADPRQPRFLVEELLPEICARYPIEEGADQRGLCGASFGGVTSLYTAWTYPGVFGKLLLQSGSFVFTDVGRHDRSPLFDPVVEFVNTLRADPARVGARVYMSCGTFESLIYYNRSLHPLLRDAGLSVRFQEAADGHNWIAWRDRLRDGLSYLFPGHLWMTYA
jgi:enterochelin esterase-like enzyme